MVSFESQRSFFLVQSGVSFFFSVVTYTFDVTSDKSLSDPVVKVDARVFFLECYGFQL